MVISPLLKRSGIKQSGQDKTQPRFLIRAAVLPLQNRRLECRHLIWHKRRKWNRPQTANRSNSCYKSLKMICSLILMCRSGVGGGVDTTRIHFGTFRGPSSSVAHDFNFPLSKFSQDGQRFVWLASCNVPTSKTKLWEEERAKNIRNLCAWQLSSFYICQERWRFCVCDGAQECVIHWLLSEHPVGQERRSRWSSWRWRTSTTAL